MKSNRKGFTQASLNLSNWKFVVFEVLLISIVMGLYFENIYLFLLTLIALLVAFYFEISAILMSLILSLVWALVPSLLASLFYDVSFFEALPELLASPTAQVLAIIIFCIVFYFHKASSDFLHDALEPIMSIFTNAVKTKKIKNSGSSLRKRKTIKSNVSSISFIVDGKVEPYALKLFLEDRGFGLYQAIEDRNAAKQLILNDNGIIKFYTLGEIKRWVSQFIKNSAPRSHDLLGIWQKFTDTPLKNTVIDHLQVYSSNGFKNTSKLELLKDAENECYLAFKNGIVRINDEGMSFSEHGKLGGAIFETSMIEEGKRSFTGSLNPDVSPQKHSRKLFRKFVERSVLYRNTDSDNGNWQEEYIPDEHTEKALLSLRTALGYLIHKYNNPSQSKAIFFVDKFSTTGKPEGGTGKSLILGSLKYLLKHASQDGKKYREGRFQFSTVEQDTNYIFIDDLKRDFNIESIFTMITGDNEIERKWENKFVIPKDERPKIALTTNFPLSIKGTSYRRRIHQVSLGDYWNRCINEGMEPKDILGMELFGNSFEQSDWNDFYIFLMGCVQDYLQYGLVNET